MFPKQSECGRNILRKKICFCRKCRWKNLFKLCENNNFKMIEANKARSSFFVPFLIRITAVIWRFLTLSIDSWKPLLNQLLCQHTKVLSSWFPLRFNRKNEALRINSILVSEKNEKTFTFSMIFGKAFSSFDKRD